MNGKQQNLTPKSLVIGSLVAASASLGAIVAAPLSAKAQNSPVTPTSVVNIPPTVVDFTNLRLDAETSTTTTTTTTTQEGTTTTTTSETTSTTTTSSNQETTQVSTSEETSGSTTTEISTEVLESVPISTTGLGATSSVTAETTTTSTETVAVVISFSQQYALATGMDAAFISELASLLGIDADFLVGTLIFDRARGLQGNRQAAMEAFINALRRAGVFEIGAFNNEAFAQLFGSYATAEELAAIFNGLSDIRIRFLAQASRFFANKGFRFRLARKNISFAQFFLYKYTGTRAIGFPPARGGNNRRDDD
jgi:hypothetical protein